MEAKHTRGDLQQMQSLPLEAKILMTKRRVREWYEFWNGDVYLSFSGGKDSTVLKHIIDGIGLDIPAIFVNTGLEYPEIQRFAMSQPNVTAIRPKKMFPDVIKEFGYPVISKEVSRTVYWANKGSEWALKMMNGERMHGDHLSAYNKAKWAYLMDAPFNIADECCYRLKKEPLKAIEKERKPIMAMMAEESRRREWSWEAYGCNGFEMKKPRSLPMAFWTEQDVLHYIKKYDVPICSVYGEIVPKGEIDGQTSLDYDTEILTTTGAKRTGCIFCMFGCHLDEEPNRFQRLKQTHPRQYEYCIGGGEYVDGVWQPNKEGLGMGKVLDYIGVKY